MATYTSTIAETLATSLPRLNVVEERRDLYLLLCDLLLFQGDIPRELVETSLTRDPRVLYIGPTLSVNESAS